MCDSCSHGGSSRGRHASSFLIVGALIVTLAALAIVSVATRASGAHRAVSCSSVERVSADYAAAITRDLHAGTATLLADTDAFTNRIRADARCQETRTVLRSARAALTRICTPCVARLNRSARG